MKVSNPLTIIAIFSGVAECFATVALINLPQEMQAIFIYFVMFFPILIVVAFFIVLFFKPYVLYAPSDYKDEGMFLTTLKIREAVSEVINNENIEGGDSKSLEFRLNQAIQKNIYKIEKEHILSAVAQGYDSCGTLTVVTGYSPRVVVEVTKMLLDSNELIRDQ
ncbi:ArsR family transcriptional regulator, partial [Vibrio anguillarum]